MEGNPAHPTLATDQRRNPTLFSGKPVFWANLFFIGNVGNLYMFFRQFCIRE